MDVETLEKISCLLGIYSSLGTLYSGGEKHIRRWLKNRNDRDGKTPLQLLARQPAISFYKLRRNVAAQTQGYQIWRGSCVEAAAVSERLLLVGSVDCSKFATHSTTGPIV